MRLKLDENIPRSARARLNAIGHDADTVLDESLGGHPDPDIWAASQLDDRILVTQDMDFSDARQFAPGTHFGILLVRLPDSEQWRIGDYLISCTQPAPGTTSVQLAVACEGWHDWQKHCLNRRYCPQCHRCEHHL